MGTTFIEESYQSKVSKVSKKGVKLLRRLSKGQEQGDLDVYLHAIEGVSKALSMESFGHLADQVMVKDDKGQVRWWLSKEKQFVEALPASSEGAYPVPLRMGKNTQGEKISFWLLHQKDNLFDLIYEVEAQEKKRFEEIKFVSEVGDRLILESQEGIIHEVDNDFKRILIGLDERFINKKKPSEIKEFLKDKQAHTPALSLRGFRDALSRPLMCWYEVRGDLYYISSYEGHPKLCYKGSSKEGLGLIYDQDQKALYTLEGIRGEDLDRGYKVTPSGAVVLDRVSKQEKIISGIKSVLSDGKSLQVEDNEGCLWVCDMKRSFKKWQLARVDTEVLKGEVRGDSISEKIQKAKDNLSKDQGLEIPAFVSLGGPGYYAVGSRKLLLIHLEGKERLAEVLGVDEDYGYVNLEEKLYQIPLKDHWRPGEGWPGRKVIGEGRIKRVEASLVLLEGFLSKEALTLLRGIKDIKAVYLNAAQVKKQDISLFHVNVPLIEEQERAPVVIALGKENVPYGEIQIHFDYNASAHYKIFKEQEGLIIGHGSGKKELIIKKAFFYAQRAKIEFHIQKGSSEKKVLPLEKIVKCIKSLAGSAGESESKTIKIEDLVDLIQLSSNEIIKDSGED